MATRTGGLGSASCLPQPYPIQPDPDLTGNWFCLPLAHRRRSNSDRSNPRGGDDPFCSTEGHSIIDIKFDGPMVLYGEEEPYSKVRGRGSDLLGPPSAQAPLAGRHLGQAPQCTPTARCTLVPSKCIDPQPARPFETQVLDEITNIEGVVATGLLLNVATAAVIAKAGSQPQLVQLKK